MQKGWKKDDAYQLAFELGLELGFVLAKGKDQEGNPVTNAVANQGRCSYQSVRYLRLLADDDNQSKSRKDCLRLIALPSYWPLTGAAMEVTIRSRALLGRQSAFENEALQEA